MSLILNSLDGSNPLAFLAALGTFRLIHLAGEREVKLRWVRDGAWRPELVGHETDERSLCVRLLRAAKEFLPSEMFTEILGQDITVDQSKFREFVRAAHESTAAGDRNMSDFAASFGSEVRVQEGKERIEYTDLCFITGSGHQHFLGAMRELKQNTLADHIYDALFGEWKKNKKLSMRWDPSDAAEYAFRWGDPSAEGASAVWGANLLAIHALPFFVAQPTARGLRTTGFRYPKQRPEFTWPIWTGPVSVDTVRSLISLSELQEDEGDLNHAALQARGIAEVYRAPRVRIGQGANFKVSFRPARAV